MSQGSSMELLPQALLIQREGEEAKGNTCKRKSAAFQDLPGYSVSLQSAPFLPLRHQTLSIILKTHLKS